MPVMDEGGQGASLANVEALFGELAAIYGARFADMWRGTDTEKVKSAWAMALSGYRMGEVRRGLQGCRQKPWPPTLPEFLLLCRSEPDYESLFARAQVEAGKRARGEDVWPDATLFWTAFSFGFYDLKTLAWQSARARFTRIYSEVAARGDALSPVPKAAMALAHDAGIPAARESARRHLAFIRSCLRPACAPGGNGGNDREDVMTEKEEGQ